MGLDTSRAWQALKTLEDAITQHDQEERPDVCLTLRDGAIRRFAYSYELCWKLVWRWLLDNVDPESSVAMSRKDLFRHAAREKLIDDTSNWFRYQEARNLSTPTHFGDNAQKAFDTAIPFPADARRLLAQLDARNA